MPMHVCACTSARQKQKKAPVLFRIGAFLRRYSQISLKREQYLHHRLQACDPHPHNRDQDDKYG